MAVMVPGLLVPGPLGSTLSSTSGPGTPTGKDCAVARIQQPFPELLAAADNLGLPPMTLRKMNFADWERLVHISEGQRAKLLGWSPGGAAAEIGISRQAIHEAIRRGTLDAVAVYEGKRLRMFMIPDESLRHYAETVTKPYFESRKQSA